MHNVSIALVICRAAVPLALFCVLLVPSSAGAQVTTRAQRLERVASLISSNQLDEAEQQLHRMLRLEPNEAGALNLFGAIRAQQGRHNEAEALFLRAVRNDRLLIGARMNLAYLYLLMGVPDKTAVELRKVLSLQPRNAEAAYRLAWLLLSQRHFDECISLMEKVRQSQTPSAAMLAILGDAYLGKRNATKAEESYLLAIAKDSSNADALLGLAQVSQIKGDADTAVGYLERASSLMTSAELLAKLARVALTLNLKTDAVAALKQAIDLKPDEPSYHFALGLAWLKQPADLAGAEQSFREFLKFKPDDAQGQLHLGYLLLKQKNYPESREWLLKSIRKGVTTPETFYYLGLIARGENDDLRAIELFQKSIQLAPSFASAHVALGSIYLKLKDYPRAQQSLETGVRLSPEDSKGHYNLAMLYARIKNPDKAQEEMRILARLESQGKREDDEASIEPPSPR